TPDALADGVPDAVRERTSRGEVHLNCARLLPPPASRARASISSNSALDLALQSRLRVSNVVRDPLTLAFVFQEDFSFNGVSFRTSIPCPPRGDHLRAEDP